MKNCIACGMPMNLPEDFAASDTKKEYCRYCSREDGSMQNYSEKLASMTSFIMRTQGLDMKKAKLKSIEMMAELPAWKIKQP